MNKYWVLTLRSQILFGLLPMLAGASIACLGWMWTRDASAFVENVRQSEAKVLRFLPGTGGALVELEYLDEQGVPYVKQFPVSGSEEAELRRIERSTVVYDVRDPKKAEHGHIVNANNQLWLDWTVVGLGSLLLVAGVAHVARRAQQISRITKLFRTGPLVQTQVRDATLAPGKQAGRFTFAFRGPNGRWYEGKSPELPLAMFQEWPVGRPLTAAFDPLEPRHNEADIFGMIESRRKGTASQV